MSAATSDLQPRPNLMTREQLLHRILYSGEITKVGQHLALVIFLVAEGKNQLNMSIRQLEGITGWSRSMLADHLAELEIFMRITFGRGRAKTLFELQGVIEDAIATAVVSATRTQEQRSEDLASATRTEEKPSVRQPDATADTSATRTQEQRSESASRTLPDPEQKKGLPHTPSKENNSLSRFESEDGDPREEADATQVRVNCTAIYGPGFKLDFGAIDMAASMISMPKDRARAIAEICARDWVANGTKPQAPMAMVRRALTNEANNEQVHQVRMAKARGSQPMKTFKR